MTDHTPPTADPFGAIVKELEAGDIPMGPPRPAQPDRLAEARQRAAEARPPTLAQLEGEGRRRKTDPARHVTPAQRRSPVRR